MSSRITDVMILNEVHVFPDVKPDKAQAAKVLEEAAEVFGAWQKWDTFHAERRTFSDSDARAAGVLKSRITSEIADVIQACCNLAAALGVDYIGDAMLECERRNEKRGRYEIKETK